MTRWAGASLKRGSNGFCCDACGLRLRVGLQQVQVSVDIRFAAAPPLACTLPWGRRWEARRAGRVGGVSHSFGLYIGI